MKSLLKYTAVACTACMAIGNLTSCKEEFLETDNYDLIDPAYMYENDAHILQGLTGVYDMLVPNGDDGDNTDGDWGFKPNVFVGCHPSMDTQCTGWDKAFLAQAWSAQTSELNQGWNHAYMAISKCNTLLEGIQGLETGGKTGRSAEVLKIVEGEAKAIRGFFYTWLGTTFGRVPILEIGESYATHLEKPRASYEEMWDFIIKDLTDAAEKLDWKPYNDQYGRCTKGMALTYLGDAYMWKAFRCPDKKQDCLKSAKKALKQVLDEGPYELSPSFTTNWDAAAVWNKECIWAEVLDEGSNWSNWSNYTSRMFTKFYCACPENGGWGSLYLPWEWYSCYEHGDKRRDGSCVTGSVPQADLDKYGIEKSEYCYGVHPYLQENIGNGKEDTKVNQFHFYNGEYAPAIWSSKLWRMASASAPGGGWGGGIWEPTIIYWKRLPNVMLDYAECCFELNEDVADAWKQLDDLRDRAFGNKEVGKKDDLTAKYLPYYNSLASFLGRPALTEYPIPFNETAVNVEKAEQYYTTYASQKGFKAPVWKVAINTERRKEFNCEWCLVPDMRKSGFIEEHIAINYPKDNTDGEALTNYPWTHRTFDYIDGKMDMPIPSDELLKNPLCDQNPGY